MNRNKLGSLLGICRKAGKLGLGHDAVTESVRKRQSAMVLLTEDASPRHGREISMINDTLPIRELPLSSEELSVFVGKKCCILSINDIGFAKAINKLSEEEELPYGIEIQNS